jgi:hypothetical protein
VYLYHDSISASNQFIDADSIAGYLIAAEGYESLTYNKIIEYKDKLKSLTACKIRFGIGHPSK